MAPPTGVSDSILVARRNGASLEPYYGALANPLKSYSMETNENKIRKNWGDRWKVSKAGKLPIDSEMIETSNFMVHPDYLHKYGTLSNGVITKSIKCAESWLYSTVGVRGAPTQRPSLFLYPGVVAPPPRIVNPNGYGKTPAAYLAPYASPDRNGYVVSPSPCFGTKQSDFRLFQCNDCGKDIRPGACSVCKKCGEKRNGTCISTLSKGSRPSLRDSVSIRDKRTTSVTNPYNLMRKSRLGVNETIDTSLFSKERSHNKKRNASASPLRNQSREIFDTFKPKQIEKETKLRKNAEEEWASAEEEVTRRRSILECEVNPYELNKSKLLDDYDSGDGFKEESPKLNGKLKILRPKLGKTDLRKGSGSKGDHEKSKVQSEPIKTSEVRLSGQRFKIFDHSNPSTKIVEGYVSDDDVPKITTETLIPRLESPKRPPRKQKEKTFDEIGFKNSKSKSKSSPNLSIKSILKKPMENDDSSVLELPFECEYSNTCVTLQSETQTLQPGQNKKQSQSTLKKKKQVQFRVNNSYESLNSHPASDSELISEYPETSTFVSKDENSVKFKEIETLQEDQVQRSKSCENLEFVGKLDNEPNVEVEIGTKKKKEEEKEDKKVGLVEEVLKKKEEEEERIERKSVTDNGQRGLHTEEKKIPQGSPLKRSNSDRRTSSGSVQCKDDLFWPSSSPPNPNLFNDTMALRTRNTRLDSREVFLDDKNGSKNGKLIIEKVKNKTLVVENEFKKSTKLTGNVITYEEFSKRTQSPIPSKENGTLKALNKKSKAPAKSNIPVKTKAPAPSPPPRQPHSTKSTKSKNNGGVSVKILSEGTKNSSSSISKVVEKHEEEVVLRKSSGWGTVSCNSDSSEGKTVVTLSPVQIESPTESLSNDGKRASITIHPKNLVEEPKDQPQRKTSVIISNFHPQDSNKVTISVRNDSTDPEPNSSTCTIIETGSNSTVIPVVSTDNKTTLIVGSNTPVMTPNTEEDVNPPSFSPTPLQNEIPKQEKPSQYIFSAEQANINQEIELMDPVEAVRRNLVPHICGKDSNGPTLMDKIKQSREAKDQKSLKQISQLFTNSVLPEDPNAPAQPSESLITSYRNKKGNSKPSSAKIEEESSTATSRSNSFCSTVNSSMKSSNTSRSSSFRSNGYARAENDLDGTQPLKLARSKFYILTDAEEQSGPERDKLEVEYEVRNGYKDDKKEDTENIYETIKEEPIYDQIGSKTDNEESEDDVPPPLPLSLPPSLEEVEKQRSIKSIFEGASKYDILNYLVDAKERVQEDSYFSGSEDIECRRLSSLEESERTSLDNSNSKQTSEDDSEKLNEGKCSPTENDSGLELSSRISQLSYSSEDNVILSAVPEKETLKLMRKSSAEIERNDSGVGSEASHTSRSKWQVYSSAREEPHHLCEDCDQVVETQITDGGVMYVPLVCRKCSKRRSERKEIIQEIVETEEKYGRDLKIILEEFYKPMLVAGLLTPDQLSTIFLNTEELLENSEQLTERLRDTLEIAQEQGDEDFLTVNLGKLFLEAGPMLHAFESYCTRQGAAAVLLANLEKEKELLRIFLRVSQMENTVLRRMNLNSFLMVPVQRVTKYPLLLARLYKVTPSQQEGRELLKEAQHNIELHLEHMNSVSKEAKDVSTTKVWRRFSTSTVSGRKSTAELEMINIKLRKMAVDMLEWNHEEVRFVLEGKLLYTQPTESNWKRGRTIKLAPIFVLLVTLGKPNSKYKVDPNDDELTFPTKTGIREATLLLVKEKCGRYTLIREPLYLDKIIVCCEAEVDEYFEVQELSTKDSFIFKAEDGERTKEWYKQLQYHAQILGSWRRRRNALANIMINGMMARAYTN